MARAALWLLVCACAAVLQGAASKFPDPPWMTLEDRNVTYIALDGIDPQLDPYHARAERILLRIFLVAMHESAGSPTASAEPPESQILVRAAINRESLDQMPRWDIDGNPRHHFTCMAHKWAPRFFLRAEEDGQEFPLAFMDEVPGLPWYFTHCPHPRGGFDPADNIKPFFMQGHVPAAYSGQQFQLHVEGWDNYGPLRLKPQTRHDEQEEQEFWNVIQLAGHDLQPDLREQFAPTVAMHTEYHLLIGFTGTLIVADHETIALLVRHPAANELIQSGRLVPLLWHEEYTACTSSLCFGEQRAAATVRALYAPLTYTVAALFMWSTHAYLGLIDLDEFLLITRHQTSVQQLLALPECFDRWPYLVVERYAIEPLAPTPDVPHVLQIMAKQGHTSAKQVMAQFEYTNRKSHLWKSYSAAEAIHAASIHDVLVVNATQRFIPGGNDSTCAYVGHAHSWWIYREFEEVPTSRETPGPYYEDKRWMWALDVPMPPAHHTSRLLQHAGR